jgi:mannose-1-phosphate guanylyltransferase/phosphomannomutase
MVPIVNRPVMEHILLLLKRHDVTEVVVTVQYLARMIQDYFGNGEGLGMRLHYSVEDVPLGTAGSVKLAQHLLDDSFLVISGDALTDFDLGALIQYHRAKKSVATITLTHVPDPLEYGVVITESSGRIRQFLEKPSWSEVISDTINTGIYVLEPEVLQRCPSGQPFDFSHDLFPGLLADDQPLYGYIAEGYWTDVGTIPEYMRACFDMLEQKVRAENGELGIPIGDGDAGDIWCGEGCEISPQATLRGPIYIGHNAHVGPGVIVDGPAVIDDNTIVEPGAHIARSILWRSCYVGERAEVRGAIVGEQCVLKTNVVLFEGAVVGDASTVDEGAIIQANVKIWPNKEIEAGASVASSIVWGQRGQRALFHRHAIRGLANIDVTPEFAARLGAAYGATLPVGSTVAINRDLYRTSRMVKRAISAGLPSSGVNVADCSSLPLPVLRYYIRTRKDLVGGVHVRLDPHDGRVVEARLLDKDGRDMSKNAERKIEALFFREDFRRAQPEAVGSVAYPTDALDRYCTAFLEHVDAARIQHTRFRLVVDYGHGPTAEVLPSLLDRLGCDVLAFNASARDNLAGRPHGENLSENLRRVGAITAALGMDLGVVIDSTGETMLCTDEQGHAVPPMAAFAAMAALAFQAQDGVAVAAPVTASSVLEKIAAHHGGSIVRTKADPQALMATREAVRLAGDGAGGFIIPRFQPTFDAMMGLATLLELLAVTGSTLAQAVRALPAYFMGTADVPCAWEQKGKVMRILNESYGNGKATTLDGIRIDLGDEWVLVLPDADRPFFHIVAEGRSQGAATSLAEKYAAIVNGLQR